MRGLSTQLSRPNFLHELLDCTAIKYCRDSGIPTPFVVEAVPKHMRVDVRQDVNHQISGGNTSLLSGSRVYNLFVADAS